jgi:hypothetical protein
MKMPQYNVPANTQALAASQTMASQQKQAQLFSGGIGVQAPDMGGNPQVQGLADSLTKQMTQQNSQAINDQQYKGGKHKGATHRRRQKRRRVTRKKSNKKRRVKSRKNVYRKK